MLQVGPVQAISQKRLSSVRANRKTDCTKMYANYKSHVLLENGLVVPWPGGFHLHKNETKPGPMHFDVEVRVSKTLNAE